MRHTLWEPFELCLRQLQTLLEDMVEALQREREAIIEFDLEKIKKTYRQKHEKLLQIERLDLERQEMFDVLRQAAGLSRRAAMEEVLSAALPQESADGIRDRLSCIRSIAQAIQELNDEQRKYVIHSMETIQAPLKMMDSLQGGGKFQGYSEKGLMESGAPQLAVSRSV